MHAGLKHDMTFFWLWLSATFVAGYLTKLTEYGAWHRRRRFPQIVRAFFAFERRKPGRGRNGTGFGAVPAFSWGDGRIDARRKPNQAGQHVFFRVAAGSALSQIGKRRLDSICAHVGWSG